MGGRVSSTVFTATAGKPPARCWRSRVRIASFAVLLSATGLAGLAFAPAALAAVIPRSAASLVSAITGANTSGGGTLALTGGCTYTLTAANNSADGGTGLPVVKTNITVQGNGATITRSGSVAFHLLDVASAGRLTLSSLTLTNGGGGVQNFGTTTITQSTFSANGSPFGANIYSYTGFSLTISSSIVVGGVTGSNCGGQAPVTDHGYNIDTGSSCGFSGTSMNNTQPRLGALAANGGPTQTMALPAGSPAVDAIPPGTPGCTGSTDQRGTTRPQGGGCDVGAYELIQTGNGTADRAHGPGRDERGGPLGVAAMERLDRQRRDRHRLHRLPQRDGRRQHRRRQRHHVHRQHGRRLDHVLVHGRRRGRR